MTAREMSIIEREMSTPEGRRELAAAQGIADAADVLIEAFERSGLTQERLAQLLDITPGRVSQVLHGDGNVKVATLARFLSAMNHELRIVAVTEATEAARESMAQAHERASRWAHGWVGTWRDTLNVSQTVVGHVTPLYVDSDGDWEDRTHLRACLR